jgi:hypothetical protein
MAETTEVAVPRIHIKIFDQNFDLSTDNPSLDSLVDYVVNHRDVDYSQLSVTCDGEDFDIESFRKALTEEIKELLIDIKINEDDLEKALEQIPDRQ